MDEFEGFETKAFVGRLLGKGDWTGFMDKIKVGLQPAAAPAAPWQATPLLATMHSRLNLATSS